MIIEGLKICHRKQLAIWRRSFVKLTLWGLYGHFLCSGFPSTRKQKTTERGCYAFCCENHYEDDYESIVWLWVDLSGRCCCTWRDVYPGRLLGYKTILVYNLCIVSGDLRSIIQGQYLSYAPMPNYEELLRGIQYNIENYPADNATVTTHNLCKQNTMCENLL